MSENTVHTSNTPIFDQLARERDYDRLVAGGPTVRLRPTQPSYMAPGAWIAKTLPQLSPPKEKNAKLEVKIHPMEAEECGGFDRFMRDRVLEFAEKHPNATDVIVYLHEEIDGTVTIRIEGNELKGGVRIAKKPVFEVPEPKGETFTVRGESAVLPPVFVTEPKTDPIPEGMAGRQLELYKASLIASDTIAVPEQTDKRVNAASTIDARPQYGTPKPLWISDEEITDEE